MMLGPYLEKVCPGRDGQADAFGRCLVVNYLNPGHCLSLTDVSKGQYDSLPTAFLEKSLTKKLYRATLPGHLL